MKLEAFEAIEFAKNAYDTANAHAMRLWYAASLVAVPILTSSAGLSAIPIEGFIVNVDDAFPPLLLILAALNFVFIVAQLSHYRMAYIYSAMVNERQDRLDRISKEFTWQDLLLSSPIAGHNRVMPILTTFGMDRNWPLTKSLKASVDIFFGLFPSIALLIGMIILPSSSPLYLLINLVGAISLIVSLPVIWHALNWVKLFKDF